MSTESENRKRIVNVAKSYIGTVGGSSNHSDILHFFNSVKPQGYTAHSNDPWCSEFVSACAIQTFGKKDAIAYFPLTASCPRMVVEAKAKSIFVERDSYIPKMGDFILYDWDDTGKGENTNSPDHVGIVEKVKDGNITVIEGNMGSDRGKVGRRTLKVNGRYIRGFVTPHYDRIKAKVKLKSTTEIAKEVIQGKWGNGAERKKALTASGYDYDTIQKEVNRILNEKKSTSEIAKEVIQGKWGNGAERKKALTASGYDYDTIQKEVNRILEEKEKK